ncbi:unnamed protein product, partial [marine sediment metagenome]
MSIFNIFIDYMEEQKLIFYSYLSKMKIFAD